MSRDRLDTAAIVLGAGAILAALVSLIPLRSDTITNAEAAVPYSTPGGVSTVALVILLVAGAIAVGGGLLGGQPGRGMAALAGGILGAVAVLALVQNLAGTDWLSVSRSAMALLGGLGIGLLAVALTPRETG